MRSQRRIAVLAAAPLAALLLLAAPPVVAGTLEDAKSAGWVGERADGMLGIVRSDAPGDVRALVARVNEGRAEEYQRIARANGVSVDAVAALAGEKLIDRAAPGEYVLERDGWIRK